MSEETVICALRKLRKGTFKNKTARLRVLYDEIETLKQEGFSLSQIVETMKSHGLDFDFDTFKVTFYRIKKERDKINAMAVSEAKNIEPLTASNSNHGKVSVVNKSPEISSGNPLRALSGTQREGDFNHIPKAKFEVSNS